MQIDRKTGIELGRYGFLHLTGLKAIGGLKSIKDGKLSSELLEIVAEPAWFGHHSINKETDVVLLFTENGNVWAGPVQILQGVKNLVAYLCPKGEMQGDCPVLGDMEPSDVQKRAADPYCGLAS